MDRALKDYRTVAREGAEELVINKSRFIGHCAPACTEEAARAFLEGVRKKHYDATHNCYAYRIQSTGAARFSDDGEPGGTAGLPMMEVLNKQDVSDVVVVVTRYFGGVLLGAGGLVRAYSKAAALALKAAGVVEMRVGALHRTVLPYPLYDKFAAFLKKGNIRAAEPVFTDVVTVETIVPLQESQGFVAAVTEAFEGKLAPVLIKEEIMPFNKDF